MNLCPAAQAGLLDAAAAEIAESWPTHEVAQKALDPLTDHVVEQLIRRSIARVCEKTYDGSVSKGRWCDLVSFTVRSAYWGAYYGALLKSIYGAEKAAEQLRTLPVSLRPYTAAVLKWAATHTIRVDGREYRCAEDPEMN